MRFLSSVLKLAKRVRVAGGPVIAKGLKSPSCPSKIRQSVVDFAQAHHRMYTKVQRRLSDCASDVVVDPLEYEYALKAGADHIAELSAIAALGVAIICGIQSCKSCWRKKRDERIQKQLLETTNANLISDIRVLSSQILKLLQHQQGHLNQIYDKQLEFFLKRKNNLQLTTI